MVLEHVSTLRFERSHHDQQRRVIRGGGFKSYKDEVSSAARSSVRPQFHNNDTGFRVAPRLGSENLKCRFLQSTLMQLASMVNPL